MHALLGLLAAPQHLLWQFSAASAPVEPSWLRVTLFASYSSCPAAPCKLLCSPYCLQVVSFKYLARRYQIPSNHAKQ
jgi:hypothetical protein